VTANIVAALLGVEPEGEAPEGEAPEAELEAEPEGAVGEGNAPVALSHFVPEGTEKEFESVTSEHWNSWPSPPLNCTMIVAFAPSWASATPRELMFTGKQASPWAFICVKGVSRGIECPEDVLLKFPKVVGLGSKEMRMSTSAFGCSLVIATIPLLRGN